MTDPAPENKIVCLHHPKFRALDRLQKTPLGALDNRLAVGCFKLAFHDDVLLIENGSITQLITAAHPGELRVIIGEHRLIIDMWPQSTSTVTLTATDEELQAASSYFQARGIEVSHGEAHAG
ncbi:MAG: hypothetical protein QM766_18340 [Burkholderiaceae bacterium]